MYVPAQFAETRTEVLHELMTSHPFATFVTLVDAEIIVNHLPLLLAPGAGEFGTLRGHVARANPLWRQLSAGAEAVAVFNGPQSYITPSWYPGKRAHGKVVPTWNYAVVHAHGRARAVDDVHWLREHVTALTNRHESGRPTPWQVTDAPHEYVQRMLSSIVGIEMPVTRLVGKWKVNQNREAADRRGVVAGLQAQGDAASLAMAALVQQRLEPGDGG